MSVEGDRGALLQRAATRAAAKTEAATESRSIRGTTSRCGEEATRCCAHDSHGGGGSSKTARKSLNGASLVGAPFVQQPVLKGTTRLGLASFRNTIYKLMAV
jgi:hypothetical protein